MLLLFKTLEINGDIERFANDALVAIVKLLDPGIMQNMADRHGLQPVGNRPWEKTFHRGIG